VSVRILPPNLPKVKYFHWDSRRLDNVNRLAGYELSDTTSASTTSTTRVTLKSYSFTAGGTGYKIRVLVWGYGDATYSTYLILNVDGVDVASVTIPAGDTTDKLRVDYVADIPSGSHTVKVDGYVTGGTLTVTKVFIAVGLAITSTTPTTIASVNLAGTWVLEVNGNFVYRLGVRFKVRGNRKTTATASISHNLANFTVAINNLGAGNDIDKSAVDLYAGTGDYRDDPSISMAVGATGDLIIVTAVYIFPVLRGNLADSLRNSTWWHGVIVREKGLVVASGRVISLDGVGYYAQYNMITLGGPRAIWASGSGTDVGFTAPVAPNTFELAVHSSYGDDRFYKSYFLTLRVVVLAP
jgi:hypothetical protein